MYRLFVSDDDQIICSTLGNLVKHLGETPQVGH
jgi:hypothetical protein